MPMRLFGHYQGPQGFRQGFAVHGRTLTSEDGITPLQRAPQLALAQLRS
jgi:hypothetical protein